MNNNEALHYRVSIRQTFFPENPWISYDSDTLNQRLLRPLTFRSAGYVADTTQAWYKQVSELVQEAKSKNPPSYGEVKPVGSLQYVHKLAKQVWRQPEELRNGLLIMPFAHLQATKPFPLPGKVTSSLTIRIFPQGPIITKLVATVPPDRFDRSFAASMRTAFRSKLPLLHESLESLIFMKTEDPNQEQSRAISSPLVKVSGETLSILKIHETIKQDNIKTTSRITRENNESPFTYSLHLETPAEKTYQDFAKQVELVIDWYNAYRGFLQWSYPHLLNGKAWNIHQWVWFYSLLMYAFNPHAMSQDLPSAKLYPHLLRTALTRNQWDLLLTPQKKGVSEWNTLVNLYAKNAEHNAIFLKPILDRYSGLVIEPQLDQHLTDHDPRKYTPRLSKKNAAVLAFLITVILTYLKNPRDLSPFRSCLEHELSFSSRFAWAKRLTTSYMKQESFIQYIETIGWISPFAVREFYTKKYLKSENCPHAETLADIYDTIPKTEKNPPPLSQLGWSTKEFSPFRSSMFPELLDLRLVSYKPGKGKTQYLVRANVSHPFVLSILREKIMTSPKNNFKESTH